MFYMFFQGSGINLFEDFLFMLGYFNLWGWIIPIMGLIILAGSTAAILIIYKVIVKILNRRITLQGSSPDVYNGLKFLIRLIVGIIIIIFVMNFLNIQSSYLIIVTGIILSAISFASMNAITNFIAGVWILVVRPFTLGDYITINGTDGIVIEISLNYTKLKRIDETIILIPNVNCINTNIINHSISKQWLTQEIRRLEQTKIELESYIKDEEKTKFKILQEMEQELSLTREILDIMEDSEKNFFSISDEEQAEEISHSKYVQKNKIVRYILELNLDKRVNRNDR
ncbi:MAG: mechanosensitive ion channel, partial [Candidatus Lokiarchaeota archaeon]